MLLYVKDDSHSPSVVADTQTVTRAGEGLHVYTDLYRHRHRLHGGVSPTRQGLQPKWIVSLLIMVRTSHTNQAVAILGWPTLPVDLHIHGILWMYVYIYPK